MIFCGETQRECDECSFKGTDLCVPCDGYCKNCNMIDCALVGELKE
jgi:hypothetical protein